jgi:uncharacterized protein (DUF305 family)
MKLQNLIGIITIGSALALHGFAADEKKNSDKHAGTPMASMIASKAGADFEAAFLGLMTLHHQGGVKMAKVAVDKAQSDELKGMMKKAIAQQEKEIEQMTAWLKEWHKKSPSDFEEPKESKEMMKKSMAEIHAASGKEFDRVFAAKMAKHHQSAIEMGHLAHEKAQHEEAKVLGAKIASTQEKEQKELLAMAK